MKLFISLLVLLGAGSYGGLFAYKYVIGGDVYDLVDYFSDPHEISREDLVALYERERPGLIAGYQRKDKPYTKEYPEFRAVSTFPAKPGVHSGRYMMTYVNDIGYDTYVKYGADPMPIGSIVTKESFKLRPNGEFYPYSLFIMEKVATEKAPETNGWFYDRVLYDGTTGMPASQDFCHSCHKAYAHQDSLGFPVKEARLNFSANDATAAPAMLTQGDVAQGETDFQICRACHAVGPDATNRVGPVLNNVIGRTAGTYPGFSYSSSLKQAGEDGLVWSDEQIFEWINGPSDFLKEHLDDPSASSKMFLELDDPQMRSDIISYLQTFSEQTQSE